MRVVRYCFLAFVRVTLVIAGYTTVIYPITHHYDLPWSVLTIAFWIGKYIAAPAFVFGRIADLVCMAAPDSRVAQWAVRMRNSRPDVIDLLGGWFTWMLLVAAFIGGNSLGQWFMQRVTIGPGAVADAFAVTGILYLSTQILKSKR